MSPSPPTQTTHTASSVPAQKSAISHAIFDALSDSGYVRESQLVQDRKRKDAKAPLPFSAPTLWRKVKAGTFPRPLKLSKRVTAWRVGDVREWLAKRSAESVGA